MGLISNGTYGLSGPPHKMVGWISQSTPFGKYSILKDILRNGDSLLDVGCGTGMMVDWLNENGFSDVDYHGIDLSGPFLRTFKERFPSLSDRVEKGNAVEHLPEGPFDIVASFGLTSDLNSLDDVEPFLENLFGSCKDAAIAEFWDRNLFEPVGKGDPPRSWEPSEILEIAESVCSDGEVYILHPLYKNDFAIVAFKG